MSAQRHAQAKALFRAALELPAAERQPHLARECGADTDLLADVLAMLSIEENAPDFLPTQVSASLLASPLGAPPPEQIGPFRIVRLLGEGGMGAVFEAEQERPHRRVALKLLHLGLNAPQMLRRFEFESEVLARLEHPGIARIYEAGTHDTGRGLQPWFAMELVVGEPLLQHGRDGARTLEQRIELLAKVCDAVQHAHQRGIVHRDLKPQNVMVDATGQPKVLDFGIARGTTGDLQRATLRTDKGMVIGTLQYMSPEQAAADPDAIDVRTDVYSLGVMLYELVAGRPPLDLDALPLHEALRQVLEVEPASLRRTGIRVPTDVAVITHKALAKDKEQRYASAAELGADLRRFLSREPITALPPSGWYRLRRFAARNRALVGGMATTFAALVVGLLAALWQRNEAREALARAEGINHFLLSDLLTSPSPERLGRDVRVVDVLAPAVHSAERAFAAQPRVAAEVLDGVGTSYRALGLIPEAERVTRRALALLGEHGDDRLSLRARSHLVGVLTELDRADEAVALGESVVTASSRKYGSKDVDTLDRRFDLAVARWSAEQRDRSIDELRAIIADMEQVLGGEHVRTLTAWSQLAVNLAANGANTEAQQVLTRTLAIQDRVLGAEHPSTLGARGYFGWMLTLGGEFEQAAATYAQLIPVLEIVYGPDHPYTAQNRAAGAQCLLHLQHGTEAETEVRRACADLERRLGAEHAWVFDARLMLIDVLFRKGDHAAALAEAERAVATCRNTGVVDEALGHALAKLGRSRQAARDNRGAAEAFLEAAAVYRTAFGKPTDFLAQMLFNLGVATRDAGDPGAAIASLSEALDLDIVLWGAGHGHVVGDRTNLARTLLAAGRPAEALEQVRTALASPAIADLDPIRVLGYRLMEGRTLIRLGRHEEGERCLVDALAACESLGPEASTTARRTRESLVELYEHQGRAADAAHIRDHAR